MDLPFCECFVRTNKCTAKCRPSSPGSVCRRFLDSTEIAQLTSALGKPLAPAELESAMASMGADGKLPDDALSRRVLKDL